MKLKSSNQILFHAASLALCATAAMAMAAAACNQTCGWRTVPFPFGFSSGCEIQLNCSPNGTALASEFPVLAISSDTILANLPAVCNRPVEALGRLFTRNYAPTFLNAVLLQNCSGDPNSCFIPTTEVRANFELLDCGGHTNDSIRCYSQADNSSLFMDYGRLRRSGCTSLFSAISIKSLDMSNLSVSLDVRIVRLGWWRLGRCGCSDHAKCEAVSPPGNVEVAAYRCRCVDGFVGDGFRDGMGCRRDQECNLSKYLSGECRGATRILVLIGVIAAGVTVTAAAAITLRFVVKLSKVWSRSRRHRSLKLKETASITIPIYNYKEMEKATNFFSDKKMLGTGAYGTVYSGKLSNDKWVAIKRLKQRDHGPGDIQHVINEIKLLSSVKHPNLSGGGEGTLWSVNKVGELAFRCLAFDRDLRPSMMDVLVELEQIAAAGSKSSSNLVVNEEDGSLCKVSSSKKSLKMQMDLSPIASVIDSLGSDESSSSSNS
ncbi:hypothetical protein SASPL_133989 [Salvia splendens]|uniref:Protein kinase domain-containing protein n=1 Tax=Salvia splendens TaxID=180675 RepID=A0A8X8X5A5_SALSN|nr:hypothetical protein SASPL_133989 [Salvia splendens]